MRTRVLVLLALFYSISPACATGRLSKIRPGMTRTDVAIELGKPAEVRVDKEAVIWVYPSSKTEICFIKFLNQRVVPEPIKCDGSEALRKTAEEYAQYLPRMNSEIEYTGRVKRYCGVKPLPQEGCRISEQCINGGWEEICP